MYLEETTREVEERMIEGFAPEAAASVKTTRPHFVVFGCTSAGSLGGHKYDQEICQRLSGITGVPTIGVFCPVREALRRLKTLSLAAITPYVDDLNNSIKKGLEEDGFEVVADAIFVSCTNLRAIEALPLLKPQFKPSIVTSTTATLEAILSMTKRIPPGQPELARG